MKTTVIETPVPQKELEFPLIARNTASGHIVIFLSEEEGVMIYRGNCMHEIPMFRPHEFHLSYGKSNSLFEIMESPVTVKFEF